MIALLLALWVHAAQAQDLANGQDIAAWRDLEVRRLEGDARLQAWEDLLVNWPDSPLAEVAWLELQAAGALEQVLLEHPELKPYAESLQQSAATHERALRRAPAHIVVADLSPEGQPQASAPPRFSSGVSLQGGWNGGSAFGAVGARVSVSWASILLRVGLGEPRENGTGPAVWYAEWGLRGYLPFTLGITRRILPVGLFGEADVATSGRWKALGGARLLLGPHWSIEASTGLSARGGKFGPVASAEVVYAL